MKTTPSVPQAEGTTRRSFTRDASSVVGNKAFVAVLSFVSGAILARTLGPEGKGILSALLVIPGLFTSLMSMGVPRATAYYLGQKKYADDSVISVTLFFLLTTSFASIGVSATVLYFLDNPNFTPLLIALAVLHVPLTLILSYSSGVFLGKEQIRQFNRVSRISEVIRLMAIVGLVAAAGFHVAGALLATLLASVSVGIYALWRISRHAPLRVRFIPSIAKGMLGLGSVHALVQFASVLNYKLDVVMMERLSSVSELGQYSLGVATAQLLWYLPAALNPLVFSRSANAKDAREFTKSVAKLLRLSFLIATAGALGLFLVAEHIIPFIYGEAFRPSVEVIQLLLPGIVTATLFKTLVSDLSGKGRPSISLFAIVPAVIVNVGLNIVWIPTLGANGAALASSVSYSVAALILIVMYSRLTGLSVLELWWYRRSDFNLIGRFARKLRQGFERRH